MRWFTIYKIFFTSIVLLSLNTTYFCDNSRLELVIRNNLNGDFSIIKDLSEIKPGAFININWKRKKLMLPYSLRREYLLFADGKWDWSYKLDEKGLPIVKSPTLYELLPSGKTKKHLCDLIQNHPDL